MSATKSSLAFGVVRSPNLAATARRYNANRPVRRAPVGLGVSLAAVASITLWIAIGAGAHMVIAEGLRLVGALPA